MQRLVIAVLTLSFVLSLSQLQNPQAVELLNDSVDNRKPERSIRLEILVNAPIDKVWDAWTTRDGIKSFFAPECEIDLRVLGKFEVLFAPQAPPGMRGAEGNLILAIQEGKMLAFTWDAPTKFPNIRKQRTSVVLRFARLDSSKTRLTLTHSGWGEGAEWDQVYDYFIGAWGDAVLPYLKHSLESGPIDWKNPPQKLTKATRIDADR